MAGTVDGVRSGLGLKDDSRMEAYQFETRTRGFRVCRDGNPTSACVVVVKTSSPLGSHNFRRRHPRPHKSSGRSLTGCPYAMVGDVG